MAALHPDDHYNACSSCEITFTVTEDNHEWLGDVLHFDREETGSGRSLKANVAELMGLHKIDRLAPQLSSLSVLTL